MNCGGEKGIGTPGFWIDAWNGFATAKPVGSVFRDSEFWDQKAADYGNERPDAIRHARQLVSRLAEKGIVRKGIRILDIGSGPGTFAIPFAECGASVQCLDVSRRMIDRIHREFPDALRFLVRTRAGAWSDVDLDASGWVNRFDLVFAHMTPAINSATDFLKMIRASRSWCFLAGWAGDRRIQPLDDLYLQLTGESRRSMHFYFALNLLYCSCTYPELLFHRHEWERRESIDSALNSFVNFFRRFLSIPEEKLLADIRRYLEQRYNGGDVILLHTGTVGEMLWSVEPRT